jgi:crossover junction endodeoxyribonuclease RuvC
LSQVILGIDPGLSGGLALVKDKTLIGVSPMPVCVFDNGKRRVDAKGLVEFISKCGIDPDAIWIEEVGARPGQGVTAMFSFGFGAGTLYGTFSVLCPEASIQYVRPQKWQKEFWAEAEDTKAESIAVATTIYGKEALIPEGARTPSDGISDALLIATYGLAHT